MSWLVLTPLALSQSPHLFDATQGLRCAWRYRAGLPGTTLSLGEHIWHQVVPVRGLSGSGRQLGGQRCATFAVAPQEPLPVRLIRRWSGGYRYQEARHLHWSSHQCHPR